MPPHNLGGNMTHATAKQKLFDRKTKVYLNFFLKYLQNKEKCLILQILENDNKTEHNLLILFL